VGRIGGRHKQDFPQPESGLAKRGMRHSQMSVVDRVERSAEYRCVRLNQTRSMVTVLIRTSFFGRSEESFGNLEIFSGTS